VKALNSNSSTTKKRKKKEKKRKRKRNPGAVVHAFISSYAGGGDWRVMV
jgi:hypothetical protein